MRYIIIILFITIGIISSNAQISSKDKKVIDSLKFEINSTTNDSLQVILLLELGESMLPFNSDTVLIIEQSIKQKCEETLKEQKSISENKRVFFENSLSTALNNLGYLYEALGKIESALNYYNESLQLKENSKDLDGYGLALNNLGLLYRNQGEYNNALSYLSKSVQIRKEHSIKSLAGDTYWNIALTYGDMGDSIEYNNYLDSASYYYKLYGGDFGLASMYYTQGIKAKANNDFDDMIFNFKNIIPLYLKSDKLDYVCRAYTWIAYAFLKKSQFNIALIYADSATTIANELKYVVRFEKIAQIKYSIYKKTNDWSNALAMYEVHVQMRDSMKNEQTQKATIKQQTKYEFEKEQLVKEQKEKEIARIEAEKIDRRNSLQYSVILVAILVVFGIVMSLGFIKVSPQVAEGLIFFAFLILFEFLLVLTDPYIDNITNSEPMYKLLANAFLAGAIFPAHAFFERTLKRRLLKNTNEK